jgi:NADPH-dependent glutamate synthase beta subunit-like oxidoreductase
LSEEGVELEFERPDTEDPALVLVVELTEVATVDDVEPVRDKVVVVVGGGTTGTGALLKTTKFGVSNEREEPQIPRVTEAQYL